MAGSRSSTGLREELALQQEANRVLEGVLSAMRHRVGEAEAQTANWRGYVARPATPSACARPRQPFMSAFRALKHVFRARALIRRRLHIVRGDGGVDANWYRYRYPDVARQRLEPALHYLLYGAYEGRDPNADFSTLDYIGQHPDVWESGLDPFSHALRRTPPAIGIREISD